MRGIKYVSIWENTGYGEAARRYLLGLAETGILLTWTPMVPGNRLKLGYQPFTGVAIGDPELDAFCNRKIDYDTVIVHTVPEYYPFWRSMETVKRFIGCTVWETDVIPTHWRALLELADLLLVPCVWNREIFIKCGVRTPIAIVPYIIDEREIITLAEPFCPAPPDYVFYTINAWTCRKAIWNTVCAYCETFTARDTVTLIIKTTKIDLTRKLFGRYLYNSRAALRKLLREYDAAPKIEMITDELSSEEILKLHARGDCYVSLCRSEGWGMGAFDAARFGRPVIITGYGGQLDYLSRELSYLVDYRESPVDDKLNERSYSQDQRWAAPDLLQAGRLMREVYQARESAQARASRLQQQILTRFNRAAVTAQMKDVLNT